VDQKLTAGEIQHLLMYLFILMTYLLNWFHVFFHKIWNEGTKTQSKIVFYEKGVSTSYGMVGNHSIGKMDPSLWLWQKILAYNNQPLEVQEFCFKMSTSLAYMCLGEYNIWKNKIMVCWKRNAHTMHVIGKTRLPQRGSCYVVRKSTLCWDASFAKVQSRNMWAWGASKG